MLISIGSSALIAIASGARDTARANYIFSVVVATSGFTALILAALFIPNVYAISKFLSSVEDLPFWLKNIWRFWFSARQFI